MASSIVDQIAECLDNKSNFLLSGGAGSGKTFTLIETLHYVFKNNPKARVASITYTNVAADEIKERSPYSKLRVSTIHDFLWDLIKSYQKNLKQIVLHLVALEKENKGSGLSYSGEMEINDGSFEIIDYQNYRALEQGIISHDDLLKIANAMFARHPLLSKILCDKFDFIFVDEYQDTQKSAIEIFLSHISKFAKGKLCVGFFGDKMQSIYESGVGNIEPFVKNKEVVEIVKDDNFRCSVNVISLLNKIRGDINQKPTKKKFDGSIANKQGSAMFVYSNNAFNLDEFKKTKYVSNWDFSNPKRTKVLFLTHRLIAQRLGFEEIITSFQNNDKLLGNKPEGLALHLLKTGELLHHFEQNNYAHVIKNMHRRIKTNADKNEISTVLSTLINDKSQSIEVLFNKLDNSGIIRKDDKLYEFIENHNDIYDGIKNLPLSQVMAYYTYYSNFSVYSTQHGIKGAEFDNVLVILVNGGWNYYNFKDYFEKTRGKDSIIKRTERIFYVCCSRAMDNLIVYYPSPSPKTIAQAKNLFGEDYVKSI